MNNTTNIIVNIISAVVVEQSFILYRNYNRTVRHSMCPHKYYFKRLSTYVYTYYRYSNTRDLFVPSVHKGLIFKYIDRDWN